MRWEDSRRSDNIEDVRGDSGGGGGGGFGIPMGGGGLGIGVIIVLAIIGYVTGIDPRVLISGVEMATNGSGGQQQRQYMPDYQRRSQDQAAQQPAGTGKAAGRDQMADFVAAILGETEDVWTEVLPAQKNVRYTDPKLVLYSGSTRSGCGTAQSAMGPFYCPVDQKVYLDMAFFNDMKRKLGGGGDFAYAYVIAHEVGHHVQNLLGILPKVRAQQEQSSQEVANGLSVRIELMADCFAGVWANHANAKWKVLEDGDIDKAMNTAAAIGDDRLQEQSRGYAVPDSFTHGSAQQRQSWLKKGLETGQVNACNTFKQ